MTKQQEFLDFWNYLTHEVAGDVEVPANVQAYIDALKTVDNAEKPLFTENGKLILTYLQSQPAQMYKARDIAEGMGISSKAVSGAMRKLVTDGYVEKVGKDPVVYTITEKGKNVEIEGENVE
jgi:DNA-binding MarR family transcriptional regulator